MSTAPLRPGAATEFCQTHTPNQLAPGDRGGAVHDETPKAPAGDELARIMHDRCPRILDAITIVRPETVVRWHRTGFAAYGRWKSRPRGGRPRINKEVRDLIRRMSFENPLWGAPKIHGELLKLGIDVAQS
jgi:hypothetical protein